MEPSHTAYEKAEDVSPRLPQAVPAREPADNRVHIADSRHCPCELDILYPAAGRLAARPTDMPRPSASLQKRLAQRIAEETGEDIVPPRPRWLEPKWKVVAPGIECKLLASDVEGRRVSALVRLAPKASYPAHTRAGLEELHLLDGELWVDDRRLVPGDYNYAQPDAPDALVWSETGCTCVLITSTDDVLHAP